MLSILDKEQDQIAFKLVEEPKIRETLDSLFRDSEELNELDFYYFVSKKRGESFYYIGTAPKDELSFLKQSFKFCLNLRIISEEARDDENLKKYIYFMTNQLSQTLRWFSNPSATSLEFQEILSGIQDYLLDYSWFTVLAEVRASLKHSFEECPVKISKIKKRAYREIQILEKP